MRLFFGLDDAGMLNDSRSQRIFGLNGSAAYIWCNLQEGDRPEGIIARLQSDFGISAKEARQYVMQSVAFWNHEGLLSGGRSFPLAPRPVVDSPVVKGDLPHLSTYAVYARRNYRLLGSVIQVRFGSALQLRWVGPVLAHLEVRQNSSPDVALDIVQHFRQITSVRKINRIDSVGYLIRGFSCSVHIR